MAVARSLYPGEDGRGNEAPDSAALRARITRARAGGDAIVLLCAKPLLPTPESETGANATTLPSQSS